MRQVLLFTHALADQTRWRILLLIRDEALCACELAEILEMPQSSVSSHLQVIRKAGILDSERCEKWIYYRVSGSIRVLIDGIIDHFAPSQGGDGTAARDAKRARKRMEKRAASCCPGPRELAGAFSQTLTKPKQK
jgi:ArsR family transcriptional regulator